MRTFIQLRDNIGFATVQVPKGEPDHTTTPDHTTAIEVFTDNPDQFLNKQYDAVSNSWTDAPLFTYAIIGDDGSIIELRNTYFPFDIHGPLFDKTISTNSKWIDGEWVAPAPVEPAVEHIQSVRIEQTSLEPVFPEISGDE